MTGSSPTADAGLDAISLGILWDRLQAVIDEAEATLMQTAFSPIIREAYDFGVVLMDANGESVVQSRRSMPSFVGTLPRTLRAALERFPRETWRPGDVFATNDPWLGTGHLPDVTMVRPAFVGDRLVGYLGCIAHWADIGGAIWSADTTEVYEEGLRLPLRKLVEAGRLNEDIAAVVLANVRLPDQVRGDMHAQLTTLEVGDRRLRELLDDLEETDPAPIFAAIQSRAEDAMRTAIERLPDGVYRHEMEIDGVDAPIRLRLALTVDGDAIHADWEGSDPQCRAGINETYNHAFAMTVYPIKCVLCPEVPNNEGTYRPITMDAPEGSIVNARFPAPVASRQILGHCLAAVVFGALARVLPDEVLADSGSPAPRLVFTGVREDGRKWGAVLTLSGGMGAQTRRDGLSAAPFPSNAGATSVEILEAAAPLLFHTRALVADSGGAGAFRGGLGVRTEVELMGDRPAGVSIMADRVEHPPLGRLGGRAAAPNVIVDGDGRRLDAKRRRSLAPGARVRVETAGGGGVGDPRERDRAALDADLREGYVTDAAAREHYEVTA